MSELVRQRRGIDRNSFAVLIELSIVGAGTGDGDRGIDLELSIRHTMAAKGMAMSEPRFDRRGNPAKSLSIFISGEARMNKNQLY